MKHSVLSNEKIAEAERAGAFWTPSIDYDNNQCRSLIHSNGLTDRLPGASKDLPIHQVCEIRINGHRTI